MRGRNVTTTRKIRLLTAGSRSTEARALEALLRQQMDIDVVAECPEILNLAELAWKHAPHVILLHVRGVRFALEVIDEILMRLPDAKLLLVVPTVSSRSAARMLEHGARGVLSAEQEFSQGIRAVRAIRAGEIWGSRTVLSIVAESGIRHAMEIHSHSKLMLNLTEREREIVNLLRVGSSNKEIASQLNISDKTVKTHLQHIFGKLKMRRRQIVFSSRRM
jgi:DNA-binding NarL/FixJ family response regulator